MAFTHEELTEYFEYLDDLRESGVTNMYGAGAYISNEYGVDHREAEKIVLAWMHTFSKAASAWDRAAVANDQGKTP